MTTSKLWLAGAAAAMLASSAQAQLPSLSGETGGGFHC
jgi:hypothetical protein